MYIKKEDFRYLETLYNSLDAESRQRFLTSFRRLVGAKAGQEVWSAIQVVGDEVLDQRGIEPTEWVTRTLIKKAFQEAKR